eukprot:COSAG06_NODE_1486_length_9299_cov_3.915435_12_plen_65_part_00
MINSSDVFGLVRGRSRTLCSRSTGSSQGRGARTHNLKDLCWLYNVLLWKRLLAKTFSGQNMWGS